MKVIKTFLWPISYLLQEIKMLPKYLFDVLHPKTLFQSWFYTIKYMDKKLLVYIGMLTIFGWIMIYSSSLIPGYELGGDYNLFVQTQLRWIILSIIAFNVVISIPYTKWKNFIMYITFFNIISLVGLFFFGSTINNATSWYDLRFMMFQPAEFVKIFMTISLAYFFYKFGEKAVSLNIVRFFKKPFELFQSIYFILGYILLLVGLIVLQPDLGSAIALLSIGLFIVMASGLELRQILYIGLIGLFLVGAGFVILQFLDIQLIEDYQLDRFRVWLNPFVDWQGDGWQSINGYIAIALGGFFGVGLGNGTQKLGWVPEVQTDFISTVIAEELGLLGILGLLLVFFLLIRRVLLLSKQAPDRYGMLIMVGFAALLFTQIFINLGGVSGLIPLTGITLPFISYGGSALLSLFVFFGVVQSVTMHINFLKEVSQDED